MNINKKGFANIVLIIVIVAIVALGGYFVFSKKSEPVAQQPTPTPTQTTTPTKVPVFIAFQETGHGCSNIFVYKINSNDTVGISVYAIKEKLNLSTTEKTFEIGKTDGLNVEILIGDKIRMLYCNDAVDPNQPKSKKLVGKTGKAIISISKIDESQPKWSSNYTATVILKDVHFIEENGNNSDVTVDELIFKDIRVGWLPG